MNSHRYLFLFSHDVVRERRSVIDGLYAEGLRVPLEYAIGCEVVADPEQAKRLFANGSYKAYSKSAFAESELEGLGPRERPLVRRWNARMAYRRSPKRPPANPDRAAPHCIFDIEKLERDVLSYIKSREGPTLGRRMIYDLRGRKMRNLPIAEGKRILRALEEHLKSETLAFHLCNALYLVQPNLLSYLLDADLLDELAKRFWRLLGEVGCWEMRGRQAVGLVVVESSRAGDPRFNDDERDAVVNGVLDGLAHLENEFPGNDLTWVVDEQRVAIDVDNGPDGDNASVNADSYFLRPAIGGISYEGNSYSESWAGLADYREDLRVETLSNHAFVIFVTPYGSSWHGYSSTGLFFILQAKHPGSNGEDWGGRGLDGISVTTIHEVVHRYNGEHEYGDDHHGRQPCGSCGGEIGCDRVPNGNCVDHPRPYECTMRGGRNEICPWTRAHIGWSHLFVELYTTDEWLAGSDDHVELDIGDRVFTLNNPGFDDREAGQKDGYAVWAGSSMARNAIRRILVRKEQDGFNGGWKLRRVKVWHEGDLICNANPNIWLENHRLHWAFSIDDSYVNTLFIEVTTSNDWWSGTDDNVSLEMGGRTWDLDTPWVNDFEAGDTNLFDLDPGTGLRRADIDQIRIRKSPDGFFAGGWKLKGLKIEINGATLYNNQNIEQWLKGSDRTFTDSV